MYINMIKYGDFPIKNGDFPLLNLLNYMGMSENGVYPQWNSHLETG